MTTRWAIGIDWDRDGDYTDETVRVLSASWSLGFQQAYMDVGNDAQLTLILRNQDRRFTPEHRAGSLFGKLAPLRPVKIESNDGQVPVATFPAGCSRSIRRPIAMGSASP